MEALVEAARQRGIAGFTADVLARNEPMLRVFHNSGYAVESRLEDGVYNLKIPFTQLPEPA